ncbi:MAG TPA: nicotinate phosphoribosyltransferase [Clostridiaceae bacterium]|nr:nicotinate phosphoribosyltransferase [Clostridiaceae bacterium]
MTNYNWNLRTNMTMLTDLYELTMMNGYLQNGLKESIACFDLFFRNVPESGGYAIMAGVQQMIDYLKDLKFEQEDIEYLKDLNLFDQDFLDYLENFEFACDVWAIPEGTPIFPGEPIVKVTGPLMQAQMIETMLLVTINHQSLIATKSSRIVRSAKKRPVMEFGARRAQGYDASVLGARAAYIAGVAGTSCTIAAQQFDIPAMGTMAHSWVQSFPTEYDAFAAYAKTYPDNTQFLVDTYNTLHSGIPNAIKVSQDILKPMGKRLKAIRIDSGDLTYLTIKAREMLDAAGLADCQITVSNAMDEYLIRELLTQGAQIDSFGVGERLITSRAEPVFGGVYKLSAIEVNGEVVPRMKISDNPEKITNPGSKEVWRFYDRDTGFALADLITLAGETIDDTQDLEIFDPYHTWKRKTLTNFRAEKLLQPIFVKGQPVYPDIPLSTIRKHCADQLDRLWDSIKRFENPQTYYVDLSQELWDLRQSFLAEHS